MNSDRKDDFTLVLTAIANSNFDKVIEIPGYYSA